MVSEKSINGESLENFRNLDILPYFVTQSPYDNSSDFGLSLDNIEQFLDLRNQAMYEGEDSTSQLQEFNVQRSETMKAELAEFACGLATAPQKAEFSRQSSLTDDWFGNVSNAHPNDISVDSSLEALFASTDWQSLEAEATDSVVTDNCFVDPSVYQSCVNCEPADDTQNTETVVSKSLSEFSTVCSLQLVVPEKVGECSSQKTEGIFYGFQLSV